MSAQVVFVVKSGDCADRDAVYGVYSTEARAERRRDHLLTEYDRKSWPGRVQVLPCELDVDVRDV
jgi:hypothetical protein